MGAPMAANLLKAGFTLTVWNRTEAKTEPLADAGAGVADAPAGVAEGADAVVSMLENGHPSSPRCCSTAASPMP